jgi:hypothetical protein
MASSLFRRSGATTVLNHIKSSFPLPISRHIPSSQQVQAQAQVPSHHFSTSTSTMSPSAPFLDAIKNRRTIYALKKESTISDAKVQEIINHVILHTPSSFNSQTTRVVLLVKEEHTKLWEITKEVLKSIVPAENYPVTEQRLNGFQAGYGTVSSHFPLIQNQTLCWFGTSTDYDDTDPLLRIHLLSTSHER